MNLKYCAKIIPTTYLKPVMFILWPLLILTCLIHILWFYRRSGILFKKKLYLDRESGFYNENQLFSDYEKIRNSCSTRSIYFFKIINYNRLRDTLGPHTTISILKNQWVIHQKQLGSKPSTLYRVSDTEFIVSSTRKKLTAQELSQSRYHFQRIYP